MIAGACTTRSFRRSARTATMWKTFCLLSLMLFTFDFPRDRFARAEPIRVNTGLVTRDDAQSYQDPRGQPGPDSTGVAVGKWRNNGEAIEPKWRDGDTIPLLPFTQFSEFSSDKIEDSEEEEDYGSRDLNYHENTGQQNPVRSGSNDRVPYHDYDYESIEDRRGYKQQQESLPRKGTSNRLPFSQSIGNFQKVKNEDPREFAENKEASSMKYREVFQVRQNDYEHELNDEEYLKPRPRKRRPPQNYEFALAENETLQERKAEKLGPISQPETRPTQVVQNAVELKSLLKMQQEEGLSLSEILQRRNLTLHDLLKGKADVITALKTKDIDETDDYFDETSKLALRPFTKHATVKKSQWTTNTAPGKTKNSSKEDEQIIPIVYADNTSSLLRKNLKNLMDLSSSNASRGKIYSKVASATAGKSIPDNLDHPRANGTPVVSTATTITTPMPLYTATNSMELLRVNEGTVKLQNSGEIKSESLDEDEIMEFSDFTDYTKGRSGMSPVWLMVNDGESSESSVESLKGTYEDKGSTLSIEQILIPTERSEPAQNVSGSSKKIEHLRNDSADNGTDLAFVNGDLIIERPEKNYNTYLEQEYQDDVPILHDSEPSTTINNPTDENKADKAVTEIVDSTEDASYEDDFSTENEQTSSKTVPTEKNADYSSTHQDTSGTEQKSYDDVISEVEPEARAEIFELFASGSAGKRLERLLKSRNMSLEELIALRQRGSSKVHLAEVSRLKARKSSSEYTMENKNNLEATTTSLLPKQNSDEDTEEDVTDEGREIKNITERYENSASDSTLHSESYAQPEDSITVPQPNLDSRNENESRDLDMNSSENEKGDVKKHHDTVQIVDLLTTFRSFPFAKDIQQNLANELNKRKSVENNRPNVVFIDNDVETIRANDTWSIIQSGHVKEVIKEEPNSIDLRAEESETKNVLGENEDGCEKGKTLSKVKPSIIASGAILGVTVIIFLAIFIACRIRQKQRYRYRNSFSRAVFQGPVMAARKLSNSSSLSTVMVNVIATSTTKRPEQKETQESMGHADPQCDIDNDSLDANDSWETIPDYMK